LQLGLHPKPEVLFFACPKLAQRGFTHFAQQSYVNTKSTQKKRQPQSGPAKAGALRCSGRAGKKELALFERYALKRSSNSFFS
jgi:hypothetical protein